MLALLSSRVEVRLLCHLHASSPAVPFLSRVSDPVDHFQYSHPRSDGVQAGVPKPSFIL